MLSQLLVILDLLLWMTPRSSSNQIGPSVLGTDFPQVPCKDIDVFYPFGYYNRNLSGFGLLCESSESGNFSMLPLLQGTYRIKNISMEGEVSIFAGAIFDSCGNHKTVHRGPGLINLDQSPYTFSDRRNKLTAIGCDVMVLLRGSRRPRNLVSGCVSFCDTPGNVINGSCSGLGCCQAAIPKGLKSFDITFKRIEDNLTFCSEEQTIGDNSSFEAHSYDIPCSQAFFVDQEEFKFSQENLSSHLSNETDHVVFLDWSIGDETCEEARTMPNYACKHNSRCYDSPSGVGYRCSCSEGYQGNPYIGCQGNFYSIFNPMDHQVFQLLRSLATTFLFTGFTKRFSSSGLISLSKSVSSVIILWYSFTKSLDPLPVCRLTGEIRFKSPSIPVVRYI